MGLPGQGKCRHCVDTKRKGETPPPDVERHALAQVARRGEDGEQQPPRPVAPQGGATDDADPFGHRTHAGNAGGVEGCGRVRPQQEQSERAGAERSQRQPAGGSHVPVRQLVEHQTQDEVAEDA